MTEFKINVSDKDLEILNQKLKLARFATDVDDQSPTDWERGTPVAEVERLTKYWIERYDWHKQEEWLNSFPQYTRKVSITDPNLTLEIHYLYIKSKNPNAIPLLFSHGWPGNAWEGARLIPYLTDQFDFISPSIPGFGWSELPKSKEFNLYHVAKIFDQLMQDLGYSTYVAQGGDFGSNITQFLGSLFPERVKAIHTNAVYCGPPMPHKAPLKFLRLLARWYPERERENVNKAIPTYLKEMAYAMAHLTKPTTIATGLTDSPVGLLAWILEKLNRLVDNYQWTEDEQITWVMLHWLPGPLGGIQLYNSSNYAPSKKYVSVPWGTSVFPGELFNPPEDWGKLVGNFKMWRMQEKGGHWAAWEQPKVLSDDLIEFYTKWYKP